MKEKINKFTKLKNKIIWGDSHTVGMTHLVATKHPDGTCEFKEYGKFISWLFFMKRRIINLKWIFIPEDIVFKIKNLDERVRNLEPKNAKKKKK
jgi:hypothetical protein